MTELNYHIMKNVIIINYNGKVFNIQRNHVITDKIIEMIKVKDFDGIIEIVDTASQINKLTGEEFEIVDGVLYSFGEEVDKYIADLIVDFYEEQLPYKYLLNLWNNIKENPSSRSRECLYRFLEANHFALTEDGKFIAYKKVNIDMMDNYTHTIDNSIGSIVTMNRDLVDDDPNITCSHGLHVASYDYAKNYSGEVLIEVKVNPRDVVAVPFDYGNAKCRCCEYEVIGLAKDENKEIVIEEDNVEDVKDVVNSDEIEGAWKDILDMVTFSVTNNPFLASIEKFAQADIENIEDIVDDALYNRSGVSTLTSATVITSNLPTECIVNRRPYNITKIINNIDLNGTWKITRRSPSSWPLGIVEAFNGVNEIKAIFAEYSTNSKSFFYYVRLQDDTLLLVKSKV